MSNIAGIIARVFVDSIDDALPLYQQLTGITEVKRFTFRDVELAAVGPFLLLSGNTAAYRNRVATVEVEHLASVTAALTHHGGRNMGRPDSDPQRSSIDRPTRRRQCVRVRGTELTARGGSAIR